MKSFKKLLYEVLMTVQVRDHYEDIYKAYQRAIYYLNSNNEIPIEDINLISKNPEHSYQIARKFVMKHKEIPKILLNSILNAKDAKISAAKLAHYYIMSSPRIFPNIPQEIIYKIKEDDKLLKVLLTKFNDRLYDIRHASPPFQQPFINAEEKELIYKNYRKKFEQFLENNPETIMFF